MTYFAARPDRLEPYTIGYWSQPGDQRVSEVCCKAGNPFEARIIAIQTVPALRAYPSLIKYILKGAN